MGGIGLYLAVSLRRHPKNVVESSSYPVLYSEQVRTEYRERVMLEKFEGIVSVYVRLGEIIAKLERELPDVLEAESLGKELKSVAIQMRSLGNRFYVHAAFYDDDTRRQMIQVVERLRELASDADDLASRVHVEDETEEELLKESLEILRERLRTFELDLSTLTRGLGGGVPLSIESQVPKRICGDTGTS